MKNRLTAKEKNEEYSKDLYEYYGFWKGEKPESLQKELERLRYEEKETFGNHSYVDPDGRLNIVNSEPRLTVLYKLGVIHSILNGRDNMTTEDFKKIDYADEAMKYEGTYENTKKILKDLGVD